MNTITIPAEIILPDYNFASLRFACEHGCKVGLMHKDIKCPYSPEFAPTLNVAWTIGFNIGHAYAEAHMISVPVVVKRTSAHKEEDTSMVNPFMTAAA